MPHSSARHLTGADTAMTEIALALAMAFFAILVLALVSMGAGQSTGTGSEARTGILSADLIPAGSDQSATPIGSSDLLVVYHGGRFLDRDLRPLTDGALNALSAVRDGDGHGNGHGGGGGQVILAVPPDLSLADTMTARGRIGRPDLLVTVLNADWIARLKGP